MTTFISCQTRLSSLRLLCFEVAKNLPSARLQQADTMGLRHFLKSHFLISLRFHEKNSKQFHTFEQVKKNIRISNNFSSKFGDFIKVLATLCLASQISWRGKKGHQVFFAQLRVQQKIAKWHRALKMFQTPISPPPLETYTKGLKGVRTRENETGRKNKNQKFLLLTPANNCLDILYLYLGSCNRVPAQFRYTTEQTSQWGQFFLEYHHNYFRILIDLNIF